MDAITLLKTDHKTVKGLFREFERLGDGATTAKRKVVDEIVKELSIHAAIEETVLYPAVKGVSDALRDDVLESLEEHHIVKWLCSELDGMDPTDERFDAKVTVLMENVRHHIEEEESELFPDVRKAMDRKALGELGELLERAKDGAPTRPHPKAPDEPPFNVLASAVSSLVDRVRDAAAGVANDASRVARRSSRSRPTAKKAASATKRTAKKAAAKTRTATKRTATRAAAKRPAAGRATTRSR
jgi:hemerythrin superfamily protein